MPHLIARNAEGSYVPVGHPDGVAEVISGQYRRVTMTSLAAAGIDSDGHVQVATHQAVDYVPVEHVDEYVAGAQKTWQQVAVGVGHDSGPGGDMQHWHDETPGVS